MRLLLKRFAYAPFGTFGMLFLEPSTPRIIPPFWTVEKPWKGNTPGISCIPEGQYQVERSRFLRKNYDCYRILGEAVKDRDPILFHKGNVPDDVQGCVAIGNRSGSLHGEWAVLDSTAAFERFMSEMDADQGPHTLTIEHAKEE